MSSEKIKVIIKTKLEKYSGDCSEEEINQGSAIPYEIQNAEHELELTKEEAENLGLEVV